MIISESRKAAWPIFYDNLFYCNCSCRSNETFLPFLVLREWQKNRFAPHDRVAPPSSIHYDFAIYTMIEYIYYNERCNINNSDTVPVKIAFHFGKKVSKFFIYIFAVQQSLTLLFYNVKAISANIESFRKKSLLLTRDNIKDVYFFLAANDISNVFT